MKQEDRDSRSEIHRILSVQPIQPPQVQMSLSTNNVSFFIYSKRSNLFEVPVPKKLL